MKRFHLTALLALPAVACQTVPEGAGSGTPVEGTPPVERVAPAEAAYKVESSTPPSAQGRDAGLGRVTGQGRAAQAWSPDELMLWKDARFQERMIESYVAETEVEPRVTGIELERLQEIMDRISSNEIEGAMEMLLDYGGPAASATFDYTIGNLYFQDDRLDEAVAAYRVAVEKYPMFRRAWKRLGLALVQKTDYVASSAALSRVIELGGNDAATYGLLGFSHSNLENDLSAELAYRMAMMLDPLSFDWKMGLARSLFRQERFEDAIALFDQLIEAEPNRADLWLLQAEAYLGKQDRIRAAENFELVDRMGAAPVETLQLLGDIYITEGLYDLGVDAYQRAIAKDTEGFAARPTRAAKVMMARGASEQTRLLLRSIEMGYAERLDVDQRKDLLKLRAQLALSDGGGDAEQAEILKQVVELDPLDGEALILLGEHAQRNNDPEQAVFYFERAASIEGSEADAKVQHARLLVSQGKYAEALPLLRRAQTLEPRDNIQNYLDQVERAAQGR